MRIFAGDSTVPPTTLPGNQAIMVSRNPNIAYINGQLKVWEYVNRKSNYGIEYYLRDMKAPFQGQQLEFDQACIVSSFQSQLIKLVPSGTPNSVDELDLNYESVGWDAVENALQTWLFKYVNDESGHRLEDPARAFESTDTGFQKSIAKHLADQIRTATKAQEIQSVVNSSDYFSGVVILLDAHHDFYELRVGTHF